MLSRGYPLTGFIFAMQTPNQVYIDVESHEMVDVIDAKVMPPEATLSGIPSKVYNEKSGRLSATNTTGSI